MGQDGVRRNTVPLGHRVRPTDTGASNDKKALLSLRWPRDARYISGSNEPLQRWPFKIIQEGGLPPTWIWCNWK